jgi:hypothetical protein
VELPPHQASHRRARLTPSTPGGAPRRPPLHAGPSSRRGGDGATGLGDKGRPAQSATDRRRCTSWGWRRRSRKETAATGKEAPDLRCCSAIAGSESNIPTTSGGERGGRRRFRGGAAATAGSTSTSSLRRADDLDLELHRAGLLRRAGPSSAVLLRIEGASPYKSRQDAGREAELRPQIAVGRSERGRRRCHRRRRREGREAECERTKAEREKEEGGRAADDGWDAVAGEYPKNAAREAYARKMQMLMR